MEDNRVFVVVGLGNPGSAYRDTRHNLGFMLVDRIAKRTGRAVWTRMGKSLLCRTHLESEQVVLAKPQTFMNRSGMAVSELVSVLAIDFEQLLVVFDDAALPFGKIRLRPSGSGGGQKGMESIVRALGTTDIPRLRIGIAPEAQPEDLSEFVLSPFDALEQRNLESVLDNAEQAVQTIVSEGFERAMNLFN